MDLEKMFAGDKVMYSNSGYKCRVRERVLKDGSKRYCLMVEGYQNCIFKTIFGMGNIDKLNTWLKEH